MALSAVEWSEALEEKFISLPFSSGSKTRSSGIAKEHDGSFIYKVYVHEASHTCGVLALDLSTGAVLYEGISARSLDRKCKISSAYQETLAGSSEAETQVLRKATLESFTVQSGMLQRAMGMQGSAVKGDRVQLTIERDFSSVNVAVSLANDTEGDSPIVEFRLDLDPLDRSQSSRVLSRQLLMPLIGSVNILSGLLEEAQVRQLERVSLREVPASQTDIDEIFGPPGQSATFFPAALLARVAAAEAGVTPAVSLIPRGSPIVSSIASIAAQEACASSKDQQESVPSGLQTRRASPAPDTHAGSNSATANFDSSQPTSSQPAAAAADGSSDDTEDEEELLTAAPRRQRSTVSPALTRRRGVSKETEVGEERGLKSPSAGRTTASPALDRASGGAKRGLSPLTPPPPPADAGSSAAHQRATQPTPSNPSQVPSTLPPTQSGATPRKKSAAQMDRERAKREEIAAIKAGAAVGEVEGQASASGDVDPASSPVKLSQRPPLTGAVRGKVRGAQRGIAKASRF